MPCNCDHLEANSREVYLSQIMCLLEELDGHSINESHWEGYHPKVYNSHIEKQEADKLIKKLCDRLQNTDVTKYSLELQMWWRDHQKADKARVVKEMDQIKTKLQKEAALEKLSPYERKLLGV